MVEKLTKKEFIRLMTSNPTALVDIFWSDTYIIPESHNSSYRKVIKHTARYLVFDNGSRLYFDQQVDYKYERIGNYVTCRMEYDEVIKVLLYHIKEDENEI